ncbi:SPFH domain-containing protein [Ethanoligenens sp.]|uniref:SPFH domain-containing protein n=1 Tax=Ethanoligenens sp. TaxID=2099655 RepID=UPI0039EC013E
MSEKPIQERELHAASGFAMLFLSIVSLIVSILLFVLAVALSNQLSGLLVGVGVVLLIVFIIISCGFFNLSPNQAAVLSLFGDYKGTSHQKGLLWTNPFYSKKKLSLRARSLNGENLKVNDAAGNPIEIAAVVVWNIGDTFKASFDVENFEAFVKVQSESAVRHLANLYPYDVSESEQTKTLRGNTEEVAQALKAELQERTDKAGILIEEARISHLAYAPEIAAVMLQRQQASAVIAARQMIVEGAVGMVQMAIDRLGEKGVVELDEERKAAMVSNLLVVLCAEKAASPIVNAGTLYH